MNSRIRFLSLNIGMKNDLAGLTTLIKVHKLDIILLQEVRMSEEQVEHLIRKYGFKAKVNIDV